MSVMANAPRKRKRVIKDPEIRAMRDAYEILSAFDKATRRRMLKWLAEVSEARRDLPPEAAP